SSCNIDRVCAVKLRVFAVSAKNAPVRMPSHEKILLSCWLLLYFYICFTNDAKKRTPHSVAPNRVRRTVRPDVLASGIAGATKGRLLDSHQHAGLCAILGKGCRAGIKGNVTKSGNFRARRQSFI